MNFVEFARKQGYKFVNEGMEIVESVLEVEATFNATKMMKEWGFAYKGEMNEYLEKLFKTDDVLPGGNKLDAVRVYHIPYSTWQHWFMNTTTTSKKLIRTAFITNGKQKIKLFHPAELDCDWDAAEKFRAEDSKETRLGKYVYIYISVKGLRDKGYTGSRNMLNRLADKYNTELFYDGDNQGWFVAVPTRKAEEDLKSIATYSRRARIYSDSNLLNDVTDQFIE